LRSPWEDPIRQFLSVTHIPPFWQGYGINDTILGMQTQNVYERVRTIGREIGVESLAAYDGRHQWARGAVKAGVDRTLALKAGGWRAGSRMLERYYGEEELVPLVSLPWE
jgi:hypothetical protein